MNPFARALKTLTSMANALDALLACPIEKTIGHDYDNPLDDPDDGGEALEPQPAVVMTLGPDEQDREWRAHTGSYWRYNSTLSQWQRRGAGDDIWTRTTPGFVPMTSGPFTEHTAQSLTWRGWAVPAILEVLAENLPVGDTPGWADWREDVAPLIADRIACDPQRAMEALKNEKVTR